MPEQNKTFLTATWSDLVFLSFRVPEELLAPYLPSGLLLDRFEDSPIMSLVAFQFLDTRIFGIKPPFVHSFAELNLRFYVRNEEGSRRGVVFISEVSPFRSVALTARLFYNERFLVIPCHATLTEHAITYRFGSVSDPRASTLTAAFAPSPSPLEEGSLAHFTVDRTLGFSKWSARRTMYYTVSHEPWLVHSAALAKFDLDGETFYGAPLAEALQAPPSCVVYSPGSKIELSVGSSYDSSKTPSTHHWRRVRRALCCAEIGAQ